MLDGVNKSLDKQIDILESILLKNKTLKCLLEILDNSSLDNYYIGAGCINQTVFNYYHHYDIEYGIGDYDIVYYDNDLSYESEDKIIKMIESKVSDKNINLDIKNEARVHLWYHKKYGRRIKAYASVEDAISRWTSTVTCIGVRYNKGRFIVYAPYGLNDLFSMTIRPIKNGASREVYCEKSLKWKDKWPKLEVVSWDGGND